MTRTTSPALAVALYLSTGIFLGYKLPVPYIPLLLLFLFSLGLIFILLKHLNQWIYWLIGLTIILMGMIHLKQDQWIFSNSIVHLAGQEQMTIEGTLMTDPIVKGDRTQLILKAESWITSDTTHITGQILVFCYQPLSFQFQYGDKVIVTGQLSLPEPKRNPGGFDYRAYLKQQNIQAIMRTTHPGNILFKSHKHGDWIMQSIILPTRRWIANHIISNYHGETRGILMALILGDRSLLDSDVRDDYARAGIIHTLAVSGLHVGFIMLIVMTLLGLIRIPEKWQLLLTIIILSIYMSITQFKPPVVRATIMAIVYLSGILLNRKPQAFNTLGIAAIIILISRPLSLFDIGFQLSFSAIASIFLFYNELNQMVWVQKLRSVSHLPIYRWLISGLLVSFTAQIGTLPITAYYFYRLPVLSIIINLIAIPLTGLIVCCCLAGLFFSAFSLWIAQSYITLTQVLVELMMKGTHWISSLTFSNISIPRPSISQTLIYLSFCLISFTTFSTKKKKGYMWMILVCLNLSIWQQVYENRRPFIRWIQFDVGQGDAALLQMPRGKTLLIDGGDRTDRFDAGARIITPYLMQQGIRTLSAVLMTHPHHDHMGGLNDIIQHFKVEQFISAGTPCSTPLNIQLQTFLKNKKIPHRIITAPDSLTSFPGILIHFLWPDSVEKCKTKNNYFNMNNQSLVFQLMFGNTSLLFTGDAETQAENQYSSSLFNQSTSLLKASHHGSITSSSQELLSHFSPDLAVISVGSHNRFGHPSHEILNRFNHHKIPVYRTDINGAIIIDVTNSDFKVSSY